MPMTANRLRYDELTHAELVVRSVAAPLRVAVSVAAVMLEHAGNVVRFGLHPFEFDAWQKATRKK
jgi:hypothetical protein